MRVWKQRAGRVLLGLIGGLGSLVAWQTAAFGICPGSENCLVPEPGKDCTMAAVESWYACSTDGASCCQYVMVRYIYSGTQCGERRSCIGRGYLATVPNATCAGGFCSSNSSSSSSSAAAPHRMNRA